MLVCRRSQIGGGSLSIQGYDGFDGSSGQAVSVDRARRDAMCPAWVEQQLSSDDGQGDQAWRVQLNWRQVFLAIGKGSTALQALGDGLYQLPAGGTMISESKQEREQTMAAYPGCTVLGRDGNFQFPKSHAYREIGEVDPTQRGIHRLDQSWIALNIGRGECRFVEEIIKRQRAVPLQNVAQRDEMFAHGGMIYSRPCGMSPANTHSARPGAVNGEKVPMCEDCLGLAQHTGGFLLHYDWACPVEQAVFAQGERRLIQFAPVCDAPDSLTRRAEVRFEIEGEVIQSVQFRARMDDASGWLRKGKLIHQESEGRLALYSQERIKWSECDMDVRWQAVPYLCKEKGLLMHRQQNIVVLLIQVIEHELQVAKRIYSCCRTTKGVSDEAGEAADR